MNTIIILGYIITILLIVKLESTRISPSERLDELEKITIIRNKVIKHYLPNYDLQEAFKILSQYIMNEVEMYGFAEHLNRTDYPPEWSKTRKLENYEYYNFFRYNFPLEAYELSAQQAEMRINYLNRIFFKNAPTLDAQILIESYYGRKLDDLMLFEDYYAITILLKNISIFYVNDPASWRMRRALYNLAIRNYNLNSDLNDTSKSCFYMNIKSKTYVNSMTLGNVFGTTDFIICSSKYLNSYTYDYENLNSKLSSYWLNNKLLITDSNLMVSLEDIVKFDDEEIYVILPKVDLKVVSDKAFFIKNGIRNVYVKIETSAIYEKSNWLTYLANQIEKYKTMEKEYFNTHPDSYV
ncbi:uncharacterized protein LOC122505103 [Leptopilina heterotoma]|uniref:uncharacterized protein LOC122505103 n=1 Tax=Leptopilina heterotoma TaxID=63436 RepID=UPI001CA94C45|nr:uncharacterized protein LOC122505103 [Leptopilina heterotoma]XP_043472489.1 uncharacterized protein LOC122505103 [Leptopilina heterotoma]